MAYAGRLPLRTSLRTAWLVDYQVIIGAVNAYGEAIIHLTVHGSQTREEIEVIVDTGYNGFLTLPSLLITTLDLPFIRRGRAILADGSESLFDVHQATVAWDERPRRVAVDAVDSDPLIGMALLHGHELTVQAVEGGDVFIRVLS